MNNNLNEYYQKLQEEYEKSKLKNLCIQCGVDLGYMNPRQYCWKTYCYNTNEKTYCYNSSKKEK